MYCQNCGAKLSDKARFCPECGFSTQPITQPTVLSPAAKTMKMESAASPSTFRATPETASARTASTGATPSAASNGAASAAAGLTPAPLRAQGASTPLESKRATKKGIALGLSTVFAMVAIGVLVFSLMSAQSADALAINNTNFPDEVFRAYVSDKLDTNHDGRLSTAERDSVTSIDLTRSAQNAAAVQDLTGLDYFGHLRYLYVVNCNLYGYYDFSQFRYLIFIYYYGNTHWEPKVSDVTHTDKENPNPPRDTDTGSSSTTTTNPDPDPTPSEPAKRTLPANDDQEILFAAQSSSSGKWIYINQGGVQVDGLSYSGAMSFSDGTVGSDGYAAVMASNSDSKWSFIGGDGSQVNSIKASAVLPYSEGWAYTSDSAASSTLSGSYGTAASTYGSSADSGILTGSGSYVDTAGNALPAAGTLSGGGEFHDGYAPAASGGQWGFIDTAGNWAIPAKYEKVTNTCKVGDKVIAAVCASGSWKYVDMTDADVMGCTFTEATAFGTNGIAAVKGKQSASTSGSAAKSGASASSSSYGAYAPSTTGATISSSDYMLIDIGGNQVGSSTFTAVQQSHSALIAVKDSSGAWGFCDNSGTTVIPCEYQAVGHFYGGYAPVQTADGKWGIINESGNMTVSASYTAIKSAGAV